MTAYQIDTAPGLVRQLLDAVARWRASLDLAHELKGLNSDEARVLLERRGIIDGPHWRLPAAAQASVRLLTRLMTSLGLDPEAMSQKKPETMRTLQQRCASCRARTRCEHEHAMGRAQATYRTFCPNAATLDGLRPSRGAS